jgi:hypothetical protein
LSLRRMGKNIKQMIKSLFPTQVFRLFSDIIIRKPLEYYFCFDI